MKSQIVSEKPKKRSQSKTEANRQERSKNKIPLIYLLIDLFID